MKLSKFSEEKIIYCFKQADAGTKVEEIGTRWQAKHSSATSKLNS